MASSVPVLSEQDVASILTYAQLIPLMRETLIAFSAGSILQPVRQMLVVEEQERYLGIMPAVTPDAMGAKLVCFYPKNAQFDRHTHLASIALFDPEFGTPLAFLDGRLITEMRTAATSAAVTQVLAAPQSRSLALIGSGVQAKAHLYALREIFPIEDVRVWSQTASNAERFAETHGARAMSAADAVDGADIVVCATSARTPVLQGAWLKPGAHVNSVGSPRPDWRELDDAVMAETVIVDSYEAAQKEAGDVILSGASIFAEAGEVLGGRKQVDRAATTIFKSVGIACEDLAAARLVFNLHKRAVR
uniref:ornithine cyclodeaminase family protein n=1 Tax=Pararhizobium sp. IMCC3301 TaxID=3067904 RepID=UPI00274039D3|nr:ornithine cyclodeaminase family protein [Pararhizobium sp. IMCC3301]